MPTTPRLRRTKSRPGDRSTHGRPRLGRCGGRPQHRLARAACRRGRGRADDQRRTRGRSSTSSARSPRRASASRRSTSSSSRISPTLGGRTFGGGEIAESDPAAFAPYLDDLLPGTRQHHAGGLTSLKQQGHGTYVQITGGSARRGHAEARPLGRSRVRDAGTRPVGGERASRARRPRRAPDRRRDDREREDAQRARGQAAREQSTSEEDVAEAVAYLAAQSPRGWTHELQITPARRPLASLTSGATPASPVQ